MINKRSTALFRPILSRLNQAGGGKKFARGGILGADNNAPSSLINEERLTSMNAEANIILPAPRVAVVEITDVTTTA